jgi:hypothetical protein
MKGGWKEEGKEGEREERRGREGRGESRNIRKKEGTTHT